MVRLIRYGWDLFQKIFGKKFFIFLFIGGLGVLINIIVTFLLTEFVFGQEKYIYSFIIGTLINITYNLIFYSKYTFKVNKISFNQKIIFYSYSWFIVFLQVYLVNFFVQLIGIKYYIFVIILIIGILSIFSFLFFKFVIFNNNNNNKKILSGKIK